MLTEQRNDFLARLVIMSQQVDAKLVVDILRHSLTFIMLLSALDPVLVVLYPTGD